MTEKHNGPRHNPIAEAAIISAIITPFMVDVDVIEELRPEEIFHSGRRELFAAAVEAKRQTGVADWVTITDVVGLERVKELARYVPQEADLPYYWVSKLPEYIQIIHQDYAFRQGMITAAQIVKLFYNYEGTPGQAYAEALHLLVEASEGAEGEVPVYTLSQGLAMVIEEQDRLARGELIRGIKPLLPSLENSLRHGVWEMGSTVLVGGDTGVGKSMFTQWLWVNSMLNQQRCVYIGKELDASFAYGRAVTMMAKHMGLSLTNEDLRTGKGGDTVREMDVTLRGDWDHYLKAIDKADTIEQIDLALRRDIAVNGPFDLVILDYLQHFNTEEKYRGEVEKMLLISEVVRRAARDFGCVVLAVVVFRKRANGQPTIDDVRSTGTIGYDSSCAYGLYFDEDELEAARMRDPADGLKWQGLMLKTLKNSRYPIPGHSLEGESIPVAIDSQTGCLSEFVIPSAYAAPGRL